MHDGGVVDPGEDISGSAHIGRQLVDLVYSLDHLADYGLFAQVADQDAGASPESPVPVHENIRGAEYYDHILTDEKDEES